MVYAVNYDYTYNSDTRTGEYTFYYYTLPEFRKLISGTDGVEPVPAMKRTVSKETFDLMGRKTSDRHKGIVIKDGKKMIVK